MNRISIAPIRMRARWLMVLMSMFMLMLMHMTGCGFQLRGYIELPQSLERVTVNAADPTSSFFQALMGQLAVNGVAVSQQNSPQASVLTIHSERLYRQALTISQDARVREYVLYLEVRYSLANAEGEMMLQDEVIRLSREYQFDEQAILGGQREEEFLGDDLARQMASQLVRSLAARLSADSQAL